MFVRPQMMGRSGSFTRTRSAFDVGLSIYIEKKTFQIKLIPWIIWEIVFFKYVWYLFWFGFGQTELKTLTISEICEL